MYSYIFTYILYMQEYSYPALGEKKTAHLCTVLVSQGWARNKNNKIYR